MRYIIPPICILILLVACYGCRDAETREINPLGDIKTIGRPGSLAPDLFSDHQGNLFLSWITQQDDSATLWLSQYRDEDWSSPGLIASGKNWFVNWADFPVIVTHNGRNFLAHYLAKRGPGTYEYDIILNVSQDEGTHWSKAGLLHDDSVAAEHGFVSMVPYGDGYFVSWLDGRNTAGGHDMVDNMKAMTLRAAIVGTDGQKSAEWELDSRVCDCCQTAAAVSASGPVVVYRNRSENELRDIWITRFSDGAWTTPVPVSSDQWQINGCPVNGPAVAAVENRLAVAWFTAASDEPAVKVAFSSDNGESFSRPVTVHQSKPTGRVDILWLNNENILVSWIENKQIRAARLHVDGSVAERYTIAETSESRSSGFPRMARYNDLVYFAWTDPDEGGQVKIRALKP